MNRQFFSIASVVLGLLGNVMLCAQEIPPPKEPILPRAPERAEWTITYRLDREKARQELLKPEAPKVREEAGNANEKQPVMPSQTRISKDGTTYREIITWSDGRQTEKWVVGGLQIQDGPNGRLQRIMLPTSFYASEYSDYSRSDFEELEWVGKSNFQGPIFSEGVSVYSFEVPGNARRLTPREKSAQAGRGELELKSEGDRKFVAYLDVKNQLPVYLDDGQLVRVYSFTKPSPGELEVPPKFAKAFEDWKAKIKQKTAVPLAP